MSLIDYKNNLYRLKINFMIESDSEYSKSWVRLKQGISCDNGAMEPVFPRVCKTVCRLRSISVVGSISCHPPKFSIEKKQEDIT